MDGLSGAASVIAVVSLAGQILQLLQGLHDFFNLITDAPQEIRRLTTILLQLRMVFENVETALQKQATLSTISSPGSFIYTAMQACEAELLVLDAIRKKVETGLSDNRRYRRRWAAVKIAVKNKEIERAELHLSQVVQLFILSVLTNLHNINIASIESNMLAWENNESRLESNMLGRENTGVPTNQRQLAAPSHVELPDASSCLRKFKKNRFHLAIPFLSMATHTKGFLTVRGDVFQAQKQYITSTEIVISVFLWLLGYFVKLKFSRERLSLGSIASIRPMLQPDASIFSLCGMGDLSSMQRVFSANNVSPFVRDTNGRSLLHYAAFGHQAETISFLLHLGVSADDRDDWGNTPLIGMALTRVTPNAKAITNTVRALVIHGQNDPSESNQSGASFLTEFVGPAESYMWALMQEEYYVDIDQRGEKGNTPAHSVAEAFGFAYWTEASRDWAEVMFQLKQKGIDLSAINKHQQTPIDLLFRWCDSEVDSGILGAEWIACLEAAGVDIRIYLNHEKALHYDGMVHDSHGMDDRAVQKQFFFDPDNVSQSERLRWEYKFSASSPAYLVLNEFRKTDWFANREAAGERARVLQARFDRAIRRVEGRQIRQGLYRKTPNAKTQHVPGSWIETM